jgi:hypothetical protein
MKPNNLLMLAMAFSATLFVSGCDRDRDAAPAATTDAPAPVEPAPAPAPEPTPPPVADSGMTFAEMDKNADGGITHDELADSEMLHQHFTTADTDGDGKLTQAEVD